MESEEEKEIWRGSAATKSVSSLLTMTVTKTSTPKCGKVRAFRVVSSRIYGAPYRAPLIPATSSMIATSVTPVTATPASQTTSAISIDAPTPTVVTASATSVGDEVAATPSSSTAAEDPVIHVSKQLSWV